MKKRWGLNPLKDAETDHLGTAARLCRLLADGLEAQSNIELDPPPARALQYYFSEAEARDYLEKIECHITNAVKNNRLRAITTTEEVPTHE